MGMTGSFIALTIGISDAPPVSALIVYPNPCTDLLMVSGNEIENIEIYNSIGKLVMKVSQENIIFAKNMIPVSMLAKGIYMVSVKSRSRGKIFKIYKD